MLQSKQRVPELVSQMLGNNLVTKQTSKDGVKVQRVMVAEALDISRETYLAILMDRESNGPVLVGSPQGGMDIEEVAAKTPDAIFKVSGCVLFVDSICHCILMAVALTNG